MLFVGTNKLGFFLVMLILRLDKVNEILKETKDSRTMSLMYHNYNHIRIRGMSS